MRFGLKSGCFVFHARIKTAPVHFAIYFCEENSRRITFTYGKTCRKYFALRFSPLKMYPDFDVDAMKSLFNRLNSGENPPLKASGSKYDFKLVANFQIDGLRKPATSAEAQKRQEEKERIEQAMRELDARNKAANQPRPVRRGE